MLNDMKILLGIDKCDISKDELLNLLLNDAKRRLKTRLGGLEPPEEMNYIVVEVAIIRYNRIGSEGVESHSVEGENTKYESSDFSAYTDEINAYLDSVNANAKKGGFRFL